MKFTRLELVQHCLGKIWVAGKHVTSHWGEELGQILIFIVSRVNHLETGITMGGKTELLK
jgi:hypothetical protein